MPLVDILGSIDDKIENNERIIQTNKQLCLSIFSDTFHGLPMCNLCDLAKITMGQSPDGASYNEEKTGKVFYQGRTDFGDWYPSERLYTTKPNRIALSGDILLSVRAPVGDINFTDNDCCIGRGLASISSPQYINFIYYALLFQKDAFKVFNDSGTVFGSISKDDLAKFAIPADNGLLINKFMNYANPINAQNHFLSKENEKLNELKQLYLKNFFG